MFLSAPSPSVKIAQGAASINGAFLGIPGDVIRYIFQKVGSADDLGRLAQVCKLFQEFANQDQVWKTLSFTQLFPPLSKGVTYIDAAVWKEHVELDAHGLDISEEVKVRPRLDKATYLKIRKLITPLPQRPAKLSLIKRMVSFAKRPPIRIEGEKGITVLTIPEGLTLRKLKAIFDAKHPGAELKVCDPIMKKYGDILIDRTYTVILTNNIFTRGRTKSIQDRLRLLEKVGCKIPKALQVATLIVMRYLSSQEEPKVRLFGDNPSTYTDTEEVIELKGIGYPAVVGGFCTEGPNVHFYSILENSLGNMGYQGFEAIGGSIAGVWEFPAIES